MIKTVWMSRNSNDPCPLLSITLASWRPVTAYNAARYSANWLTVSQSQEAHNSNYILSLTYIPYFCS